MKTTLIIILSTFFYLNGFGQNENKSTLTIGLEQDILPYVLKGYIATVWFGRDMFRYRLSYANANSPKFFLKDNIESDQVKAFGISFEYFFKENFEGLWFGPGVGYWTNYINTKNQEKIRNESVIATFGGGYNINITNWLYFSPWVAMHFRVSGNDEVPLTEGTFKPALLTPEVSLKLGVRIPTFKN